MQVSIRLLDADTGDVLAQRNVAPVLPATADSIPKCGQAPAGIEFEILASEVKPDGRLAGRALALAGEIFRVSDGAQVGTLRPTDSFRCDTPTISCDPVQTVDRARLDSLSKELFRTYVFRAAVLTRQQPSLTPREEARIRALVSRAIRLQNTNWELSWKLPPSINPNCTGVQNVVQCSTVDLTPLFSAYIDNTRESHDIVERILGILKRKVPGTKLGSNIRVQSARFRDMIVKEVEQFAVSSTECGPGVRIVSAS